MSCRAVVVGVVRRKTELAGGARCHGDGGQIGIGQRRPDLKDRLPVGIRDRGVPHGLVVVGAPRWVGDASEVGHAAHAVPVGKYMIDMVDHLVQVMGVAAGPIHQLIALQHIGLTPGQLPAQPRSVLVVRLLLVTVAIVECRVELIEVGTGNEVRCLVGARNRGRVEKRHADRRGAHDACTAQEGPAPHHPNIAVHKYARPE